MNDEKEGYECITIALIPAYNPCGGASLGYTTDWTWGISIVVDISK